MGGGGGCNVFLTFYAISTISRNKIWEYKTIISHLMFSSCFFLYAGNIEKCPVTYSYWLNGKWFFQIVDIPVGNFIMRLEILNSFVSQMWGWFGGGGVIYPIITKIVVLVFEPFRRRSRATELPCFTFGQLFMRIEANSDTSSVGPSNKDHPFGR